jgi:RimJ/RimL family protein N-acetyltransferase
MSDSSRRESYTITIDDDHPGSTTLRTELVDVDDRDHSWLIELHNDPVVLRNLTDPTRITEERHMQWWRSLNVEREIRKIFTINGRNVGFCKFTVDRNNFSCVLGADIHRDYRGKGYSYLMWELMLSHCFNDLGMHRVSLTTAVYNEIGRKVYTRLGFLQEGVLVESLYRDGKFEDQICMFMLRTQYATRNHP